MGTETVRFYQEQAQADQAKQIIDLQAERARRLAEPESPVQTLGTLALAYLIGGAMAHGAVLPRTEAVTVEGVAGATEAADRLRRHAA